MTLSARTRKKEPGITENGKSDRCTSTTMDRQVLIDGLNHDLAGEYQAILMYTHYSAKLTGPYRRELRALFQAEIADEQAHAQFLSDKIAALGGEPTTEPTPVPHVCQARQMLDCALSAEVQAIADYSTRIHQAETCGDVGLKVALKTRSPTRPGTRRSSNASSPAGITVDGCFGLFARHIFCSDWLAPSPAPAEVRGGHVPLSNRGLAGEVPAATERVFRRRSSMFRFVLLSSALVAATSLSGSNVQADDQKYHDHLMKCAKACADCQVQCDSCFQHCAELVARGDKGHVVTMHTCLDCAEWCKLAASLTARHSPFAEEASSCCMKCADDCAKACEKFPDDEHMVECAKSCRQCVKACKELIDRSMRAKGPQK